MKVLYKLVVGKIKNEIVGAVIEEFVVLKPKVYSIWQMIIATIKKAKGVNRNIVATIRHNEYKDVLLNKKCLRISHEYSKNIIQSKDHRKGLY